MWTNGSAPKVHIDEHGQRRLVDGHHRTLMPKPTLWQRLTRAWWAVRAFFGWA